MKRSVAFLLFMLMAFGAAAQNITVADFKLRDTDMTAASKEGKRIDQNGQPAALIRIETTETDFVFEAGALGIVDSKQEVGEVWVWVPRASRKITIKHPKLGVLYDYRYPLEIEAERTYWMKLVTGKVITTIQEEVRMQYLTFQVTPPNATLEVNDQLWSLDADGIATKYVDFGTYTYRVRASDYFPDAGRVVVDDPENTKVVPVTLIPNRAEVTLKVDADAEIWVNNERKGTRTWTGSLGSGTFKIECKQAGHETSVVSKEITAEMNGQTITLPAPTPIYGSLNVESTPQMATLYIDGREVGKTPRSINEILVGQHEIRLVKEGYADYKETVTINKGERKQVRVELQVAKQPGQQGNSGRQWNTTALEIDENFVASASCDELVQMLRAKMDENPNDAGLFKDIATILEKTNCTDSRLFLDAAVKFNELEPGPDASYFLGIKLFKDKKYGDAAAFFEQATKTENSDRKYRAYRNLGMCHENMGSLSHARDIYRKAAQVDPTNGEPYLLIAMLYAGSAKRFSGEIESKAVYWAAVDKCMTAKQLDPSCAEKANALIRAYSAAFPTMEKIFFNDYNEGQSFNVGGWIGETTTVRARK